MIALDTSVVVAALLSWHEGHESARRAASGGAIPAHALLESYSVLTRLPAPHRVAPDVANRLLTGWFSPDTILHPAPALGASIVARLATAGIAGGAVYDALVALTAAEHGAELRTRDRRAAVTYDALSVPYQLVDG